jgi:hypothetical protein
VDLDQLASKIKTAIESQFNAKLVSLNITRNGDMWGIQFGSPMDTYRVSLEVIQSKHKLLSGEYPAHDINQLLRNDVLQPALGDNGRLMSISTNISSNSNFRSTLEFITHDVNAFADALSDFVWKSYSNQFDSLIESELSKD